MEEIREQFREMVIYLLNGKPTDDEEVIESYTETLMFGAEQYYRQKIEQRQKSPIHTIIKSVCPVCSGSGEVQQTDIDWDECRTCNGTGQIETKRFGV